MTFAVLPPVFEIYLPLLVFSSPSLSKLPSSLTWTIALASWLSPWTHSCLLHSVLHMGARVISLKCISLWHPPQHTHIISTSSMPKVSVLFSEASTSPVYLSSLISCDTAQHSGLSVLDYNVFQLTQPTDFAHAVPSTQSILPSPFWLVHTYNFSNFSLVITKV